MSSQERIITEHGDYIYQEVLRSAVAYGYASPELIDGVFSVVLGKSGDNHEEKVHEITEYANASLDAAEKEEGILHCFLTGGKLFPIMMVASVGDIGPAYWVSIHVDEDLAIKTMNIG
ncbi:hypothetical protein HN588_07605 [Candidatus Bathyarchaeota archaeon]|jgi:hypothetical protein|nr:hypothetical protein [Candidatus Bathyarchaeota archaeon]